MESTGGCARRRCSPRTDRLGGRLSFKFAEGADGAQRTSSEARARSKNSYVRESMPKQHVLYIICISNERNRARRFRSSTADDKSRQDRDVGAARQPLKE
ncbi:hypothetical protein HCEG_01418 [Histoplasma capsulatum var. duboisii H88]|uniref:Uncharacterized protein n=2 Tax=Ajellomyces capsulatus TaxID=5037 RepID=F0U513_AJEC8|nr:hypothetical protein HCDG_01560 [Histoplasma capsulatum H143]EGC42056.1 hypothetical protein HCEG_01418 [Histoplasma capsulatum var. duboisii H88]